MIKGTPELISERREEIINACETLYQTMSFKEITLKEISGITSFSRPTIYNYFQTKEEIFLSLFEREYDRWNEALEGILESSGQHSKAQLAEMISRSLADRKQLLKLLSMNNYDMEANSRREMLTSFKTSYGRSMQLIRSILEKYRPEMTAEEVRNFIYIFFPFMFGIYPYAEVTEKQHAAMDEAGVGYVDHSIFELTYNCLISLLNDK